MYESWYIPVLENKKSSVENANHKVQLDYLIG